MPIISTSNKGNVVVNAVRAVGILLLLVVVLPVGVFAFFVIRGWVDSSRKTSEMERLVKAWQDTALLEREGGRFYTFNYDPDPQKGAAGQQDAYLYEFSPRENRWEKHTYPAFRQACTQDGCVKNALHTGWDVRNRCFIAAKSQLSTSRPFTSSFYTVDLNTRQEEWLSFTADRAFFSAAADKILLLSCLPGYVEGGRAKGSCAARIYDRKTRVASEELPVSLHEGYAYEGTLDWDRSGKKILFRNAQGSIEEYVLSGKSKKYFVYGKDPKWTADGQGFYFRPDEGCGLDKYTFSAGKAETVLTCDGKFFLYDNYLTPSRESVVGWACLGPGAPRDCAFFGVVMADLKDPARRLILKDLDDRGSTSAVWDAGAAGE